MRRGANRLPQGLGWKMVRMGICRRAGLFLLLGVAWAFFPQMPQGAVLAQESQAELAELFYRYTKDNVVFDYTDPAERLPSGETAQKLYDGFLALAQADLDADGAQELLAIRAMPWKNGDGQTVDAIVAEVYRRQENSLRRAAQSVLAEGKLSFCAAQIDVFFVHLESGPVLCCEARGTNPTPAGDLGWSFRAISFDGADFQEVGAHSLRGTSFEEVDFSGIVATMGSLGLTPTDPTVEMATDQNDWVDWVCQVRRAIDDASVLQADPATFGGEAKPYGKTQFQSFVNGDAENKLQKEFVTAQSRADGEATAPGGGAGDAGAGGNAQGPDGGAAAGTYAYDGDFVFADSDRRYLTQEDLSPLSDMELLLARNEIYARRGFIFNEDALQAYFASKSWYQPVLSGDQFTEDYASQVFNSFEVANISAIVTYEAQKKEQAQEGNGQ